MTITHDVLLGDCLVPGQMIYWYEPDYLSGYTGCSHCDAANKGDAGFGNSGAPCGYTPFDATVSGGAHFYEHDHHDLAALYAKGTPANCTAWAAAGHNCSTDAVGALLCGAHCSVAPPAAHDAASIAAEEFLTSAPSSTLPQPGPLECLPAASSGRMWTILAPPRARAAAAEPVCMF